MELTPMRKRKNPAAVALGRLGGLKSSAGRMRKMTPEQRSALSRAAAEIRWRGKKPPPTK